MARSSYNLTQDVSDSSPGDMNSKVRVLAYREKVPTPEIGYQNKLRLLYSRAGADKKVTLIPKRPLPSSPERKLGAPDIKTDFYLNIIDWGKQGVLAVALNNVVYLWNSENSRLSQLPVCNGTDYVCSVSWLNQGGDILAVGTTANTVQLWDVNRERITRLLDGHQNGVNCLDWNNHILSSGGKDSLVINHDVRSADHIASIYHGHEQQVCGLTWSPDGRHLASGGNDNTLCIYDGNGSGNTGALFTLTDHLAAVRAVAWCPYQRNILASGGGSADRSIKLWNASTGTLLTSVDTGSQVCSLCWNPHEKELLSAHGYMKNQLCLWSYPNVSMVKEFYEHQGRVLDLALSPDGTVVCSAGADEVLCLWRMFGSSRTGKKDMASKEDDGMYSSLDRIR